MSWGNLFLAACFYLALPILYAVLRNSSKERNNLILSVTLTPEGRNAPEVEGICRAYRKKLTWIFLALTVIMVFIAVLPWVSIVTTLGCLWLIAALVLPFWCFGQAHNKLKALKKARGWYTPTQGQTVVQLPPAKPMKRTPTLWFLPPVLLSALPLISLALDPWDAEEAMVLGITVGMCVFVTAMSLAFYPLVFRQRLDALDADQTLTAALTRVRRYNWTKCWLLMSYMTAAYSLAVWSTGSSMGWYLVWTGLYTVGLLVASLQTEFAARRAQRRLTLGRTEMPLVDEDDYWIWGMFYYNPNNTHLMVNERVGMGMSMNLARPAAKWLMGITAALLLLLPLLGVWLMAEEFLPIEWTLEDDTLTVSQALTTYRVDLDQVTGAELLEELPPCRRVAGTGLENLLKGGFTVDGYGSAKFCLNPKEPPFLVLETAEQTYFFGFDGAEAIYAQISEVSYE